jgi:hypothetical protein
MIWLLGWRLEPLGVIYFDASALFPLASGWRQRPLKFVTIVTVSSQFRRFSVTTRP